MGKELFGKMMVRMGKNETGFYLDGSKIKG